MSNSERDRARDRDTDRRPATAGSPNDAAIEDLLRRAGRRPPVPSADAARVKAAARAEWQRVVGVQRRRKWIGRSAAVLAAAAVLALALNPGLFQSSPGAPAEAVATVEATVGTLWATRGAEPSMASALEAGAKLAPGAVLETRTGSDPESRAVVQLASGYSLRLDTGSRLRLDSQTTVTLESGALYVDSGAVPAGAPAIAVHTQSGIVRDIGTRFTVRVGPEEQPLSVSVRDGAVVLEHAGVEHRAEAGVEMVLRNGEVTRVPTPPHGEPWTWVQALLPDYETEGRSLQDFLSWAAGEGGWTLRFEDPKMAARSAQVVLHGSITGLGLDEALELSLLSSGLDLQHRIEGQELVIERNKT